MEPIAIIGGALMGLIAYLFIGCGIFVGMFIGLLTKEKK